MFDCRQHIGVGIKVADACVAVMHYEQSKDTSAVPFCMVVGAGAVHDGTMVSVDSRSTVAAPLTCAHASAE